MSVSRIPNTVTLSVSLLTQRAFTFHRNELSASGRSLCLVKPAVAFDSFGSEPLGTRLKHRTNVQTLLSGSCNSSSECPLACKTLATPSFLELDDGSLVASSSLELRSNRTVWFSETISVYCAATTRCLAPSPLCQRVHQYQML